MYLAGNNFKIPPLPPFLGKIIEEILELQFYPNRSGGVLNCTSDLLNLLRVSKT
jgi:hypothetical protein